MTRLSIFCIFCLSLFIPPQGLSGQDMYVANLISTSKADLSATSSTAILWRGFQHQWTYNHRLNRVGSYVQMNNGMPLVAHTSATGFGPDSTYFTTNYTLLDSRDVTFLEGKVSVDLKGKEGSVLNRTHTVTLDLLPGYQSSNEIVLLNGFDIIATEGSDKVQLLKVNIGDPYTDESGLNFDVRVSMVVDCQSMECAKFNQTSDYKLDIYYLLVRGDDSFHCSTKEFSESYSWDKKIDPDNPPELKMIRGTTDHRFNSHALGVRSIELLLDKAHWFVEWNKCLNPLEQKMENGTCYFTLDMLFKEWEPGMKRNSAVPKRSKFSFKKRGWVAMDMEVVLMQFQNTDVTHSDFSGSMYWEGKNLRALGEQGSIVRTFIDKTR